MYSSLGNVHAPTKAAQKISPSKAKFESVTKSNHKPLINRYNGYVQGFDANKNGNANEATTEISSQNVTTHPRPVSRTRNWQNKKDLSTHDDLKRSSATNANQFLESLRYTQLTASNQSDTGIVTNSIVNSRVSRRRKHQTKETRNLSQPAFENFVQKISDTDHTPSVSDFSAKGKRNSGQKMYRTNNQSKVLEVPKKTDKNFFTGTVITNNFLDNNFQDSGK